MKYYILYSLKVWLSSVCIAPFIAVASDFSNSGATDGYNLTDYMALVIVEIAFSFFTWVFFLVVIAITVNSIIDDKIRKSVISISGFLMAGITFWVWSLPLDRFFIVLMAANAFTIGLGSWYFNIEPKTIQATLPDTTPSIPHEN